MHFSLRGFAGNALVVLLYIEARELLVRVIDVVAFVVVAVVFGRRDSLDPADAIFMVCENVLGFLTGRDALAFPSRRLFELTVRFFFFFFFGRVVLNFLVVASN